MSDKNHRPASDAPFYGALALLGGSYVVLVLLLVAANVFYTSPGQVLETLSSPSIQFSIKLTLISCLTSATLSLLVAVPLGYVLARMRFPGRGLAEVLVDIPVVLPPLVVGLSLLIIFNHFKIGGQSLEGWLGAQKWAGENGLQVTYAAAGVVVAQFSVAAAFAVRTMRGTFAEIPVRTEEVALTLGCSRGQAFYRVTLPQAKRGMFAAFTVAWARSLGEFGPLLVFAGTTPFRTEVLSSSVFLEIGVGKLEAAVAVSLLMIAVALVVLLLVKKIGGSRP